MLTDLIPDEIKKKWGAVVILIAIIVFFALEWDALKDHEEKAEERWREFQEFKQQYYRDH